LQPCLFGNGSHSVKSLNEWRARLDAAEAEIALVLKLVRDSAENGPLLQRLNEVHQLKQAADQQVRHITESLIASTRTSG
jgi:hypothetical protein